MFNLRATLAAGGLVVCAVAVGVASAWIVSESRNSASAQSVEVRADGVVVGQAIAPAEAVQIASQRVGFEVRSLDTVPVEGLAMRFIEIAKGPEGAPNAVPNATVFYTVKPSETRLLLAILQVNVRAELPANATTDPATDPNRKVDVRVSGVQEVWRSEVGNERGKRVTYTIFTPARSFYVTVEGFDLDEEQLGDIARDLAQ